MKLKAVILRNFRVYEQETRIPLSELTAFIGKNDSGKSSILEALEIFFNNEAVKLDRQDLCVSSGDDSTIDIGCVFTDLPNELVLDETRATSLAGEYLLNDDGDLEIHKQFNCGAERLREAVSAHARHPVNDGVNDLLHLKNSQLRQRLQQRSVDTVNVDLRANPAMRKVLWEHAGPLSFETRRISLDQEEGKKIWTTLKRHLPTYALFQSDRPSRDDDSEVQNPMKLAVKEALQSVADELDRVKQQVQATATEVAERTLNKLREMDPSLASNLRPHFQAEPKWEGIFKLSLTGDDDIPINKRGSGVRRLVLLNFFRAEAERKQHQAGSPSVVYAVEEPETSQHPSNQELLVGALRDLAAQDGCQVLLTTHVPGLAGLLDIDSIRYVAQDANGDVTVQDGTDEVLTKVAGSLGVLPDNRVKVLACVEGPNDVSFVRHISRILHASDATIPDLSADPRVVLIPLGGSTLQQWVANRYLEGLGRPEVHLYDRDDENPPRYQDIVDRVNARGDGSYAVLTGKRETECYLHPDAIAEIFGVTVTFSDNDDVARIVAKAVHESHPAANAWDGLDEQKQNKKITRAKYRLNEEVPQKMTTERVRESDPDQDIENWLREIGGRLQE